MKKIALSLIVFLLIACKGTSGGPEILSSHERSGPSFSIRVRIVREKRTFGGSLAGADYIFSVKKPFGAEWNEIMTVQTDDIEPFDGNQVVFVTDDIAFVFFKTKLALTRDGGNNWRIVDTNQMTESVVASNCSIRDASIGADGRGKIALSCGADLLEIATDDFGSEWK